MTKEDLHSGYVVELRDGTKCLFTSDERFYILDDGTWHCSLNDFLNDLTMDEEEFDIMKIYEDYTLSKVVWKRSTTKVDRLREIRCMLDEIIEEVN